MAHPIVGLWKVTGAFEDREFKTVQNYLPDGQVIIDAGIFVASGLWEATGERSTRMVSLRPIVTGTLMDREFQGWQEASAEATVNEDDILVASLTYCASRRPGREQPEEALAAT